MQRRTTPILEAAAGLLILACMAFTGLASEPGSFSHEQRNHWAFRPLLRPDVPAVESTSASPSHNPIDVFIETQLRTSHSHLASPADRTTLLRRITFDLIGLPPTPEELSAFLSDEAPDAYDRLVDRLLSSPHYGEAWGRNWLDVVRFAETAGFKEDPIRPTAYTYRDYVIKAFNSDLPYDRFVRDQLAGDEIYPDVPESLAATGYCRMWPDESNASNILLARQTSLDDLTANVGAAFLGLSIGCAQCHDHKFDPILQTDFYELQAFFSGIVLDDKVPIGTTEQLTEYRAAEQTWLAETAALRQELNLLERPARFKMQGERRMKFPPEVLEALDTPFEDRTTMQRQLAFWSARQMGVKEDDIPKHLDDDAKLRRQELQALIAEANKSRPRPLQEASVMAVSELVQTPPPTHRMLGGSYDKPRELMSPHFPAVLRSEATQNPPTITPANVRSSGRRSELARWLTSPENALTHRVWANRLWQGHFGRGLVSNANDFGTQTPAPTHPELLEWLTTEFIAHGCCSKPVHRQIVLSSTYRQSSDVNAGAEDLPVASVDYAHFPRQRLSSERIRDAWLVASGQFNDAMYGPGTRPELPPNFSSYDWKPSELSQQVRRSVYIFAKRNLPYPMMAAFDFPDMHEACGCRTKTTIAPQALMLLNNQIIVQAAKNLATRARDEANSADPAARIRRAWQIAFARSATDTEVDSALKFVADQQQRIPQPESAANSNEAAKTLPQDEALADLCHALLNANEFLFID